MSIKEPEPIVMGPEGELLTAEALPGADTVRWSPRRKARVVAAVDGGLISREAALKQYKLTEEEFDSWKAAFSRFGMRGLRVTKLNFVRRAARRERRSEIPPARP